MLVCLYGLVWFLYLILRKRTHRKLLGWEGKKDFGGVGKWEKHDTNILPKKFSSEKTRNNTALISKIMIALSPKEAGKI